MQVVIQIDCAEGDFKTFIYRFRKPSTSWSSTINQKLTCVSTFGEKKLKKRIKKLCGVMNENQ
jgi:hypothetical protein